MKRYLLKENARHCGDSLHPGKIHAGTFVYELAGYDYGLASDDTRETGVEHVSVTLNENGDYPSFTVAIEDLVETP